MKTKILLLLLLICFLTSDVSFSQTGSLVRAIQYTDGLGYPLASEGTCIIKNDQNEIIIAGLLYGNPDIFMSRWSPSGNLIQQSIIASSQKGTQVNSIIQNGYGQYVTAGKFITNIGGIPYSQAMFSVMDSGFNIVTNKVIGAMVGYGTSVIETSPGNYIYAGLIYTGALRPCLLKLNSSGDVVSSVYLQLNAVATDKFRLRDIGNGRILLEGLHDLTAVMDTNFNIINQSIFGFGAITGIVKRTIDNNFVWVSHDTTGPGNAISVAVTDTLFGNIVSHIRFNAIGQILTPLKIFQDTSGNYSLYIRKVLNQNNYGLIEITLTDSLTISGLNLYELPYITGSPNSGYFPNDILSNDSGSYYSTGGAFMNPLSFSTDMAITLLDSTSFCWANSISLTDLTTSTNISPSVQVFPFVVSSSDTSLNFVSYITSTVTHCNTLSQPEITDPESMFVIYPTLATSVLNVKFGEGITKGEIQIVDLTGRLIYQENNFYPGLMDVSQFTPGSYFVIITTAEGKFARQFFKF